MRSKSWCSILLVLVILAGSTVAIAAGPRATSYKAAFRVDPLPALKAAMKLQKRGSRARVTAVEYNLLEDARDGRLDHWTMAEASLVVSGVTDANQRRRYLAQLEHIAQESMEATADAETPKAKAKALGRFLLDGPMQAGYVSGQYDLRELLDTGRYNCVSSAILFNLVARRNGLEVGAVTIPGHVFSRTRDFDFEPTSGRVHSLENRAERVSKKRKSDDNQRGAPYANRLYRETGNLGLLSTAYHDEGVDLYNAGRYAEAVVSHLKASCLDPQAATVTRSLHKSFREWFAKCKDKHQYREAASVARLYGQMLRDPAPANKMLRQLR